MTSSTMPCISRRITLAGIGALALALLVVACEDSGPIADTIKKMEAHRDSVRKICAEQTGDTKKKCDTAIAAIDSAITRLKGYDPKKGEEGEIEDLIAKAAERVEGIPVQGTDEPRRLREIAEALREIARNLF